MVSVHELLLCHGAPGGSSTTRAGRLREPADLAM